MAMYRELPPLIVDVLPGFADELQEALTEGEEDDLEEQMAFLRLVSGCGCDDDFCASFYTSPKPEEGWPGDLRNFFMQLGEGLAILDVVDETIRYVEVLDRPDVRLRIRAD